MTPTDRIMSALDARGLTVRGSAERGWNAQCPAHDDRNASLSIGVGTDGRALIHCLAGCEPKQIVHALGMEMRDLFADTAQPPERPVQPKAKEAPPLPTEDRLAEWVQQLAASELTLDRVYELRGWTRDAVTHLGIGLAGKRVVFPIRGRDGSLVNVCRYTPAPKGGEPKMLALRGRPRDLFPRPEDVAGSTLYVAEGEPDSVALWSLGLPAVGLPGAGKRDPEWWPRLAEGREQIIVVGDCDNPGRKLAREVANALSEHCPDVRLLDLDTSCDSGYDVGDLVREASVDGDDGLATARDLLKQMAQKASPLKRAPIPETEALLEEIIAFARRLVVLPGDAEATAIALYVLHTWAHEGAHATPYLLVVSPEKRSGKTRLLEVLALLVRSPWHTNSTSEAAMFRKIERDAPTLLLDEIDAIFGSSSERTEPLRAILNSGNRRGVTVTRCVGKDHEVAEFSVWCPKVLAGIDKDRRVPETIRDRSIAIRMRRRHDGESIDRLRERKAQQLAQPVRDAAEAWAGKVTSTLYEAEPDLPEQLSDRAADAWEPLLAIADLAGGEWPTRARTAALELGGEAEADETSLGSLLLAAMQRLMAGRPAISSHDLIEQLNADEDLPFGGWKDGKGIDGRGVARLLKPYGVKSRTTRIREETPKAYRAEDLRDAWTRYVRSEPAVSENEPQQNPDPQRQTARKQRDVADVADVALLTGMGENGSHDAPPIAAHKQPNGPDSERTIADLSDEEILAIFPGSAIEHIEAAV